MVRGVLEAHGYEEPIFIGEGSFAKVYRVRDKEGCFWACRVHLFIYVSCMEFIEVNDCK